MTPRECAPMTGWDNLPPQGDTGADLARVKWYRNKLAHSEVGKLSKADFSQYWGDLEGVCIKKIFVTIISNYLIKTFLIKLDLLFFYTLPSCSRRLVF